MNFVFRVDASPIIGIGHLMRCLTLANTIKNSLSKLNINYQIIFICSPLNAYLSDKITSAGFSLIEVDALTSKQDQLRDAKACNQYFDNLDQVALLVVDHYKISHTWYNSVNSSNINKVLAVDDLADRKIICDLILDQTFLATKSKYQHLVPNDCAVLLGQKYMLLRAEFHALREKAKAKRTQFKQLNNLLVAIGGTDQNQLLPRLVTAIEKTRDQQQLTFTTCLVTQEDTPSYAVLIELAARLPWLEIITNCDHMAQLMYQADIAIGAAGTTSWERCCLGLPTLTFEIADNQKNVIKALSDVGAIISLGKPGECLEKEISKSISQLIEPTKYLSTSNSAFECCDGLGSQRAFNRLNLSHLVLKPATPQDCQILFNLQSQPGARKFSRNTHKISIKEHTAWFNASLQNSNRHLFMIQEQWHAKKQINVGMVRLDKQDEHTFEISILICEKQKGRGLAFRAIKQLLANYELFEILAAVHPENLASHRLFQSLGFTKLSSDSYKLYKTQNSVSD